MCSTPIVKRQKNMKLDKESYIHIKEIFQLPLLAMVDIIYDAYLLEWHDALNIDTLKHVYIV